LIVLDASAAVELLLNTASGRRIAARLEDAGEIHCPHLIDVEIVQILRRLVAGGDITLDRAGTALEHWSSLDLERHPHAPFLDRIWAMRDDFPPRDAIYVALAEILRAPLLTGDRELAGSADTSARIEPL
jgi:predicted nucleic acid-binding protein